MVDYRANIDTCARASAGCVRLGDFGYDYM